MLKQLLTVSLLAIVTAMPLLAGGCASDSNKGQYGLTGSDNEMTAQQRARYTDSKGHFHSDWVGEPGR